MKKIDNVLIEDISKILGELITGSKLTAILQQLKFFDHDTYHDQRIISTKWRRIAHSVEYECKRKQSASPLLLLIQKIMNPVSYTDQYEIWVESKRQINTKLSFYGFELQESGKVIKVKSSQTIDEAVKRYNSLLSNLETHNIHSNAIQFCNPELLEDNYFHAIHEGSKSILVRLRELTFSNKDGSVLIEEALSFKNPAIVINNSTLATSEQKNKHNALKHLLLTINFSYRNPTAHEAKIYNPKNENDALTSLILISQAHYILDNCSCIRYLD